MQITLIMLPGKTKVITVNEHDNIGQIFQYDKDLKDRLINDLGKNLNHKKIQFAIQHKDSDDWTIYPLIEGCMKLMYNDDKIMYSMMFGD